MPAGDPVRVGDIADIDGTGVGATVNDIIVLDASTAAKRAAKDGTVSVNLGDVRRALVASKGVNMGRLALSGSAVQVRVGDAARPAPPAALAPSDDIGDTLGSVLNDALARWFSVPSDAIQTDTQAVDPKVLATPLAGRTYAVSTGTRGEVLPVQVRVFEGDTPVLTQTIRVGIKLKKAGCVATRDIARGQTLSSGDVQAQDVWVATSVAPIDAQTALGGVAQAAMKAGDVVEDRQVDHPPTIKRGDMVSVDCVSGSILLRATMRAKQDGRAGEVIWLEPLSKASPSKRTSSKKENSNPTGGAGVGPVRARVAGPGHAVTVSDESPDSSGPTTGG